MQAHFEGLFFGSEGVFFRFNQEKRNPGPRPGINAVPSRGTFFSVQREFFYGSAPPLLKVSRRTVVPSTRKKEIPGAHLGLMQLRPEGVFFRFKGSFFSVQPGKKKSGVPAGD